MFKKLLALFFCLFSCNVLASVRANQHQVINPEVLNGDANQGSFLYARANFGISYVKEEFYSQEFNQLSMGEKQARCVRYVRVLSAIENHIANTVQRTNNLKPWLENAVIGFECAAGLIGLWAAYQAGIDNPLQNSLLALTALGAVRALKHGKEYCFAECSKYNREGIALHNLVRELKSKIREKQTELDGSTES